MKTFPILLAVSMFLFIDHANNQSFTNYTVATTSTTLCDNQIATFQSMYQLREWNLSGEGIVG
jgi:hypothetical protein